MSHRKNSNRLSRSIRLQKYELAYETCKKTLTKQKTKTKSQFGLAFMVISIVVVYLFLAPRYAVIPGLNLGAVGVSLKMVICQLIEINLSMFFVAKYIEIKFDWYYQIYTLSFLLAISFFCKISIGLQLDFLELSDQTILFIALSGVLYLGIVVVLLYRFPALVGMSKCEIDHHISRLKKMLKF